MLNLTIGHWVARLIYVAAKLKLADLLKDGPRTTAQLATATGVLFDQPSVIARAQKDQHVTAKGIAERCTLESGSFFEAVPAGGDAYIMKYILHDWNDEQCVKILANCRAAMNERGGSSSWTTSSLPATTRVGAS